MEFKTIAVNKRVAERNARIEKAANRIVRSYDGLKSALRVGGRKANYDDLNFEFRGGPADSIRKKHYDKSLRLLWKSEEHSPHLDFKDATAAEKSLFDMAVRSMTDEEKAARERLTLPEFKEMLNREYTLAQKQAIVNILAAIAHGEAYAWLVSAELLNQVESTGGRTALTMQVLEEAKHFVVLRELLLAFDVPVRRQSAWEYLLLESVFKAKGLEKFFGMNVLVEGIALGLFGQMSTMPGLEVLRLFHLDEARHTALPSNYFREFPMTRWQKLRPAAQLRRLKMVLPALPLIPFLEEDLAVLGYDALDFGGSVLRKVTALADHTGFALPLPRPVLLKLLDGLFNAYAKATREDHIPRSFIESEATVGDEELEVERKVFATMNAA